MLNDAIISVINHLGNETDWLDEALTTAYRISQPY
jgi:hypothetical protein